MVAESARGDYGTRGYGAVGLLRAVSGGSSLQGDGETDGRGGTGSGSACYGDGAACGVSGMRLIEPYHGVLGYTTRALWMASGRVGRSEPPVSRQGNKAGFAPGVFKAWGLIRARWTAAAVNDLCPVAHLFALLLASRELRDAVSRRVSAMVPCPVCLPDVVQAAWWPAEQVGMFA